MDSSFFEALRQFIHEKGISQDLVLPAIEKGLIAAYKKKYHTDINAFTLADERSGDIALYAKKEVVDEIDNPVFDIELEDARALNPDAEIGDELHIPQPLDQFGRKESQFAKQIIFQKLKDIEKNIIYSEFAARKGELINGYYQRDKNGTIFVSLGKTEGILPRNHQSPR